MSAIWAEQRRFETWLAVELAATDTMAEAGIVPADAARELREKASFDIARIDEIEQTTQHDVIAFTTAVAERVGPAARWLHFGLTSSDVVDTALALQMREACDLILEDLDALAAAIKVRAFEHKRTPMMGRTHGVHAEPMTLGLKLALWFAEVQRDIVRVRRAREAVSVGKISGAVGTFAHLPPEIEAGVCQRLGLVARADCHAGDPAGSPRRVDDHARDHGGLAGEVRARDSRAPEDGTRRSGGAVRQGPEGLLGDAAQAQPGRLRAGVRSRARGPRQRRRRPRERRALARARHLALVGRARHPARQLPGPRPHDPALHPHRRRDGRVPGADAREHRAIARRGLFRPDPARTRQAWPVARAGVPVGAAQCDAVVPRTARLPRAAAGRRRHHGRADPRRDRPHLQPRRATAPRGHAVHPRLRRTPTAPEPS